MVYVTFTNSDLVDHYDGNTTSCTSRGIALHLNACDRITVKARIHLLPIWVGNADLDRVLESRGDIKSLHHVTEKIIITVVREVVFSMTFLIWHRCTRTDVYCPSRADPPFVLNARVSATFDFNVPHGDRPRLCSYSSAVQGPVVSNGEGGPVGKVPSQAVNNPTGEEP